MSAHNMVEAFNKAIKRRLTNKELIHHYDRGLQYCACVYQKALEKYDVKPSMTDGSDCYQNALAERINGILKQEFLI
jgi:transposase InsO family protein